MNKKISTVLCQLTKFDWYCVFGFALLRFLASFKYGLGSDEAHYATYAQFLDWSYFDHPPLVGWVEALFQALFGRSEWAVRLPANLMGILVSILGFHISLKISKDKMTATAVLIALNISFLLSGLSLMFLPDSLLFPLILWLFLILNHLIERGQISDWIQLGICLGLCGLAKYTAALLLVSILGLIVTEKLWKKFISFHCLMATLIAAVIVSPVFYWNYTHHWISFAYQTHHVLGADSLDVGVFIKSLVAQVIAYSPFLVIISICSLFMTAKVSNHFVRLGLWLILPGFLFFTWSGFGAFVLPHWTSYIYGLLIILGISTGFSHLKLKKWIQGSLIATALLFAALNIELIFNLVPYPAYQSPYADLTGWPELHKDLIPILAQQKNKIALAVPDWVVGSRSYYYLSSLAPIFVLDERLDQFDLWEKESPSAYTDMIFINWRGFEFSAEQMKQCTSTENLEKKVFIMNKKPVTSVEVTLCKGFHRL